ncbi:hypothetical protein HPB50_022925 [Hyalomma asiaticum]|uniref:Uncharacterized protein n=1 Tax=Hyalomma asiaticum TaxID=266040 RepID=A0ACB7T6D9_HYAAI|nr:hypothetical protein HPB50_022925 [Hyalomma asiaticum]
MTSASRCFVQYRDAYPPVVRPKALESNLKRRSLAGHVARALRSKMLFSKKESLVTTPHATASREPANFAATHREPARGGRRCECVAKKPPLPPPSLPRTETGSARSFARRKLCICC